MPEVKRVRPGTALKPSVFSTPTSSDAASGAISIDAADFTRGHGGGALEWRTIPNLGRGPGAVTALPQGRPPTSQKDGVHLEYALEMPQARDATVQLHLLPTLNTSGDVDVRLGVSIDEGARQTLALRLIPSPDAPKVQEQRDWEKAVIDNDFVLEAKFPGLAAGAHRLKVWRLDDNMLLARIVVR